MFGSFFFMSKKRRNTLNNPYAQKRKQPHLNVEMQCKKVFGQTAGIFEFLAVDFADR